MCVFDVVKVGKYESRVRPLRLRARHQHVTHIIYSIQLFQLINFTSQLLVDHRAVANSPCSVILGSFSNYLVTKSSVPVMVARKRLRKHVKYRKTVKLANNLTGISTKRLASAKID